MFIKMIVSRKNPSRRVDILSYDTSIRKIYIAMLEEKP